MLSRIAATCTVAAMLLVTLSTAALAAGACAETKRNPATGTFQCARYVYVPTDHPYSTVSGGDPGVDVGVPAWTPPSPPYLWFVWWEWGPDTDGNDCKYIRAGWYLRPQGAEIVRLSNQAIAQHEAANGVVPLCDELADLSPGPPPIPADEVLWDAISIVLPRPDPLYVAPGKALTGLPAWLQTNRALTHIVAPSGLAAMPGGLVGVEADATFTVDWGDPFAEPDTTVYQREGVAYDDDAPDDPEGIRHTYTDIPDSGEVTITVTDAWTITFQDQWGRSDTLTGTLDTSTVIPVTELQAIVTG